MNLKAVGMAEVVIGIIFLVIVVVSLLSSGVATLLQPMTLFGTTFKFIPLGDVVMGLMISLFLIFQGFGNMNLGDMDRGLHQVHTMIKNEIEKEE